ncbi:hypothetical protein [Streptomyces sp. NPDC056987]|uniref:hypothetical protein n=1 Tax=Streptomyces sp. NPDC056987 TaxID=3345988 RepID=UPI00364535ED
MKSEKYTVWISAQHAARLRALYKKNRRGEAAYVEELVAEGLSRTEARVAAQRARAERWPALNTVVAGALTRRLAEPDLRGPWRALSADEAARLALAGRWPGANERGLAQRNYELPTDLLTALRTAAWRVSEGPLAELDALGLVRNSTSLGPVERERRRILVDRVYSPPRIVREALDRYGPQPSES